MNSNRQVKCARSFSRAEAIAKLNDQLRQRGAGGRILVTDGVYSLPQYDARELLRVLAEHTDFNDRNDPFGERDFGEIRAFGADLFWKIDYYDLQLECGSPDPADPELTVRVLTIMLKSEY